MPAEHRIIFTKEDLLAYLPQYVSRQNIPQLVHQFTKEGRRLRSGMQYEIFTYADFNPPDSEQSVETACGAKSQFENGMDFWLSVLTVNAPYLYDNLVQSAEHGLYKPIHEAEFIKTVENYSGLLKRERPDFLVELPRKKRCMAAMTVYNEWDELSLIAEYEDCYLAFLWNTSA